MKKIEEYIQFAIDNGFEDVWDFKIEQYRCAWPTRNMIWKFIIYSTEKEIGWGNPWSNMSWIDNIQVDEYIDIINLITSKTFIEAIARWIDQIRIHKIFNGHDTYWWDMQDKIVFKQAIAIRDNTLDNFITEILWQNTKN